MYIKMFTHERWLSGQHILVRLTCMLKVFTDYSEVFI